MKKIELHTESYEFESKTGRFRSIPFYELSIEEWIIYQNSKPKYFLDFGKRTSNFQEQIRIFLKKGEALESIINRIGIYLGLDWTTIHNIEGHEVENSSLTEKIELVEIDKFEDIANELFYFATDKFDEELCYNEEKLLDKFITDESIISSPIMIDRRDNIFNQIDFLFKFNKDIELISKSKDIELWNLTLAKDKIISFEELDKYYKKWIIKTERDNTMDEYGGLMGIINYVQKNLNKKKLILRIKKKKNVPNKVPKVHTP